MQSFLAAFLYYRGRTDSWTVSFFMTQTERTVGQFCFVKLKYRNCLGSAGFAIQQHWVSGFVIPSFALQIRLSGSCLPSCAFYFLIAHDFGATCI